MCHQRKSTWNSASTKNPMIKPSTIGNILTMSLRTPDWLLKNHSKPTISKELRRKRNRPVSLACFLLPISLIQMLILPRPWDTSKESLMFIVMSSESYKSKKENRLKRRFLKSLTTSKRKTLLVIWLQWKTSLVSPWSKTKWVEKTSETKC